MQPGIAPATRSEAGYRATKPEDVARVALALLRSRVLNRRPGKPRKGAVPSPSGFSAGMSAAMSRIAIFTNMEGAVNADDLRTATIY